MHVEFPPEEVQRLGAEVLRLAIERAGVVQAIAQAAEAQLALRGLLTKEQAMAFLGIKSERTLEQWMRPAGVNGGRGLPHLKIGENVRFKLASLEAWADRFEVNKVLPAAA